MRRKGFTLIEIMLSVAIMGIVALMISLTQKYIFESIRRSSVEVELQSEANAIFQKFQRQLSSAGDGVVNSRSPLGCSIFASPPSAYSEYILFLSKDNGILGQMDAADEWTEFTVDNNGKVAERKFISPDWTSIRDAAGARVCAAPAPTTMVMNSLDIKISTMTFTFYRSNRVQSNDAYAASWVRVRLVLEKLGIQLNKHFWILLKNVVYTQQA